MRRRLEIPILALLLPGIILAGCSRDKNVTEQAQASIAWSATLGEARLEAQKTGERILASFEAYWCPWSRLLRESLYVDPAVIESLGSFKCVSIDADRDSALSAEYDIRLYPTIVVMDEYGREIERIVGYQPPAEFLKRLSSVKARDALVTEMFRREEQSAPDAPFLMDFADLLRNAGTYDAALLRYEKAADLDKGNRQGIFEEATYAMAECNLLAGEYREAGRRFRYFAEANPASERRAEALVLAALCFERARDRSDAIDMLNTCRRGSSGELAKFAADRLEKLRGRGGR